MGTFPADHEIPALRNQQRMVVLRVNENLTSQIPSCWATSAGLGTHPALPDQVPPVEHRMQRVEGKWAVLQCPHCHKIWQRDVNACR